MTNLPKRLLLLLLVNCFFCSVPSSVYAEGKGGVNIVIVPCFNGQPLKDDQQVFTDEAGDALKIILFKFYITNVQLLDVSGGNGVEAARQSHLFDWEDSATYKFSLSAYSGNYAYVSFNIGVDSIDNTSGANAGDLDPVKGMYWAWNSGYIMAKLEGTSAACATLHHAFEFHIGGYQWPNNAVRSVRLPLPADFKVAPSGETTIYLKADCSAWFSGKLLLATTNSILIPGKAAMDMADRYQHMFSIQMPGK